VTLGNAHLYYFVSTFLKVNCRLQCQIDSASQVNQILLSKVLNNVLLWLLFVDLVLVLLKLFQLQDVFFAEDVPFDLLPLLFSFLIEGVLSEDIEFVLTIDGIIHIKWMCELVVQFD
jgi:hypothetical protein